MNEIPSNFRKIVFTLLLLIGGALLIYNSVNRSAPTYNATVSGTVTIDGILAKSGTVTYHPLAGGQPAIGNIYSDGTYALRSGQGDLSDPDGGGIASGGYVVTVAINAPATENENAEIGGPPVPGPSLVAAKYRSKKTSDLKRIVKPGASVFVLNLESSATDEAELGQAEDSTDGESPDAESTDAESIDAASTDERAPTGGDAEASAADEDSSNEESAENQTSEPIGGQDDNQ